MIARLSGRIIERDLESVVVDVQGVGYEVHCGAIAAGQLQDQTQVSLWIHTAVREDAITLYGFLSLNEKSLFMALLSVNGVGPKLALKILSAAPLAQLLTMIQSADVAGLSRLPKVGKKTAEQMVVSLRGKLGFETRAVPAPVAQTRSEIISALVNLGYRVQDVDRVVTQMPVDLDLQSGIRQGLEALSQGR